MADTAKKLVNKTLSVSKKFNTFQKDRDLDIQFLRDYTQLSQCFFLQYRGHISVPKFLPAQFSVMRKVSAVVNYDLISFYNVKYTTTFALTTLKSHFKVQMPYIGNEHMCTVRGVNTGTTTAASEALAKMPDQSPYISHMSTLACNVLEINEKFLWQGHG